MELLQSDFATSNIALQDSRQNSTATKIVTNGRAPPYLVYPSSSSACTVRKELAHSPVDSSKQNGNTAADGSMQENVINAQKHISDRSLMLNILPQHRVYREAHSQIPHSLSDDITCDQYPGLMETPTVSDEGNEDLFSTYMDMEKENCLSLTSAGLPGLDTNGGTMQTTRHQQRSSVAASSSDAKQEYLMCQSQVKRSMAADKLAELALIDPKRVKRILANRQSAARSKERKMCYISELERKVQTLQLEATTLSAQVTILERNMASLNSENTQLKLRLHSMGQQVQLQDALHDTLKEEVQRLKMATGQFLSGNEHMLFFQPMKPTDFTSDSTKQESIPEGFGQEKQPADCGNNGAGITEDGMQSSEFL